MKRFLVAALALLGLPAIAGAQPVNPQVGLTWGYTPKITYSAGFIGLVPVASATDIVCLAGSATRIVRLTKLVINGTAGTIITVPIMAIRRAAVNTGGTAASTTANPANAITKADSQSPTATAVPISYTANPTITDSAGTIFAAQSLTLNVTGTTAAPNAPAVFDFGADIANLLQPIVLRGAAQQICLNLGGVSVSSGVLNGSIHWYEDTQ